MQQDLPPPPPSVGEYDEDEDQEVQQVRKELTYLNNSTNVYLSQTFARLYKSNQNCKCQQVLQSRAEQSRAEQNKTEQNKTKQSRTD